jgi:hypothetical protein
VASALGGYGARAWQVGLTAGALAEALRTPEPEPTPTPTPEP